MTCTRGPPCPVARACATAIRYRSVATTWRTRPRCRTGPRRASAAPDRYRRRNGPRPTRRPVPARERTAGRWRCGARSWVSPCGRVVLGAWRTRCGHRTAPAQDGADAPEAACAPGRCPRRTSRPARSRMSASGIPARRSRASNLASSSCSGRTSGSRSPDPPRPGPARRHGRRTAGRSRPVRCPGPSHRCCASRSPHPEPCALAQGRGSTPTSSCSLPRAGTACSPVGGNCDACSTALLSQTRGHDSCTSPVSTPSSCTRRPAITTSPWWRAGRTAYLAGQCPLDQSGDLVGSGSLERQVDQVVANALRALAAVNAQPHHVVRSLIYVRSEDRHDLGVAWGRLTEYPRAGVHHRQHALGRRTAGLPGTTRRGGSHRGPARLSPGRPRGDPIGTGSAGGQGDRISWGSPAARAWREVEAGGRCRSASR